jgi:putative transposase
MPDHFHVLVTGLETACDLLAFIRNFKQITAHEHLAKFAHELWQKKFYDHIVRPRESSASIAAYIWLNPVRKGLCANPRDYPHSGSFVVDWKTGTSFVQPWLPNWKKPRPA